MQEKTITITIDEHGSSTLDLEGFVGKECEKPLEDFRGSDTVKLKRKKPAYFAQRQLDHGQIQH